MLCEVIQLQDQISKADPLKAVNDDEQVKNDIKMIQKDIQKMVSD